MKSVSIGGLAGLYQANRILIWLCAVIFVYQLGFGSIVPAVPLYARSFGVSQSAIGLTLAVYGLARFLVNVPTGRLADHLGRRNTLVLGEAISVLGNFLCGLATTYEWFVVFRFVAGLGAGMVVTCGQVILADISTKANRGRTIGVYHSVFLAGNGFGPLPGGLLASHFGLNMPFFAFTALGIVAGALAYNKVPDTHRLRERRESTTPVLAPRASIPMLVQLRALFSQRGFVLVGIVNFSQTFARTGAITAVIPVLGASKLGLSPDQIGLGLTMVASTDLLMAYPSGMVADRFGRKLVIIPSKLVAAASLASFALAPDFFWYAFSFVLWGVAIGISGPAPAAYAADLAPPGMNAMTMSCLRLVSDLGYVIGPLLLGWFADIWSPEVSLYITAASFLVAVTLFGFLAPETTGPRAKKRVVATE